MRVLIITQDDPFYLGNNLDFLLKNMPEGIEIIGCIVFEVSPFGKRETFMDKIKRTQKVFGTGFVIRYGLQFVSNKLDKSTKVKKVLQKHNVQLITLDKGINHASSLEFISNLRPEVMVSIAGNQIFKRNLLAIPTMGTLNLHTALLPKYRGLMPTFWVLKNDEKETGVSVFYVDEGIDSGPIVVQRRVPLTNQTQKELIVQTKQIGMECILEALEKIKDGQVELIPNPDKEMTYYSFPTRKDVQEFKNGQEVLLMNILTFDIEEWFHILDNNSTKTIKEWSNYESRIHENMDKILNLMDEHNLKATFFCLGWIAEKYPEVIREINNRGFEIGSHTYMHQLIYEQNRTEFREDLKASINILEDITGKKVTSFRAPGFSLTTNVLWAFDELAANGITHDSSVFPAPRAHGGIANFGNERPHILSYNGSEIREFPINTKRIGSFKFVYSGGGYFRLFPYHYLSKWISKDEYVMTYFHPRDFDANQPLIEGLSALRRFKSYYGLGGAFNKLERWILNYKFIDLSQASKEINWSLAPKVVIS